MAELIKVTELEDGTFYVEQVCCGLNTTGKGSTKENALANLVARQVHVKAQYAEEE